jgi:hypothetical protein
MQQPKESAGAAGMLLHTNGKFTMGNWNHLFTHTIVFLTDLHCQCLGVGHGIISKLGMI